MTTVWGLVDDRTGHTGQVLGVISKLGLPYVLKRLDYNALVHVPTPLLGASMAALTPASRALITPPYPALVIAAGRRTIPTLRAIKKASPTTRTVYLMRPEVTDGIDLIAAPEHDGLAEGGNIISTLAPIHAVTSETLVAARGVWESQFAHLPRPYVALCLGGDTKHGRYKAGQWRELVHHAARLAGAGSLLITTSRRTPVEVLELIPALVRVPHLLHRWDRDRDNPYLGLLACADAVVVTGDSLSMCAEACVTGKPVFIYASASVASAKHRRLHETLYRRGMAWPLNGSADLDFEPATALDDAGKVADEIRRRFPEIIG